MLLIGGAVWRQPWCWAVPGYTTHDCNSAMLGSAGHRGSIPPYPHPISQTVHELIIVWIFCCCNFGCNDPIRSQFCTCHDSTAVMCKIVIWSDHYLSCNIIQYFHKMRFELVYCLWDEFLPHMLMERSLPMEQKIWWEFVVSAKEMSTNQMYFSDQILLALVAFPQHKCFPQFWPSTKKKINT